MEATLILFDIDGTLVDTAGAGRAGLEQAFQEVFDVGAIADRTNGVPFAGKTDFTIVRELGQALGIGMAQLESRRDRLERSYLSALDRELARPEPRRRVLPGVRELLAVLDSRKAVHLGLVTGNIEGGARRKLGAFDLNRFFPGGGFGNETTDRREVARRARQHMSEIAGIPFDPGRVSVIGDTEDDVDCARANGFRSIAVRTGWASPGSLEAAKPDALFDDLTNGEDVLASLGIQNPRATP